MRRFRGLIDRGRHMAAERGVADRATGRPGGHGPTHDAVVAVRTWADGLASDVRHAARALRATPTFTIAALVILTLSIGASTAIFSVVDAVVLRGLPFDDSHRLVAVTEPMIDGRPDWREGTWQDAAAPQNYFDWRERQDVFSGLAAIVWGEVTLRRQGSALPENIRVPAVTADFFTVLRARPLLGRAFTADDERAASGRVAVISYDLWQRRFGGRADIIGAELPGSRLSFQIVGVMPPGFAYPFDMIEPVSAWVPYIPSGDDRIRGNVFGYNLHVIGRLRDDVSVARAQARMDQITADLAASTPRWFTHRRPAVEPLHDFLTGGVRTWMMMLLAAVSIVLLIACVNLANLMLVRGTTRARELGVRTALGASRGDLSRALLAESLLLSLSGAAMGVLVAVWGVDLLRAAMPAEVPRLADVAVDTRVLAVAALTAIVTGVAFGLAPVAQIPRVPGHGMLNPAERVSTGGAGDRLRATLVIAEVALAVVLLVGSGLFLASFARVIDRDLGFDPEDVLTVRVRVLEAPADVQQFSERNRQLLLNVVDRVRGIPGVEVAALLGQGLPLRGDVQTVNLAIPGRALPEGERDIAYHQASPDYFRAMRIPLLGGRFFSASDTRASEPVVILNEAAAARYFPHDNPVGQMVRISGNRTVVGVVGNVRHDGPEGAWRTQAYVPITQGAVGGATLVVRTTPDARGVAAAVREAVWSEFPDTRIATQVEASTLGDYLDGLVAQRRFNMLILTAFGLLGLVIAAAGIYGVLSYSVARRTREIGVRMALGAQPLGILVSVVRRAALYLACGVALGAAAAWGLGVVVQGFLFEVQAQDATVHAAVVATLTATGLAAALVPARRAARVSPLVAMNAE